MTSSFDDETYGHDFPGYDNFFNIDETTLKTSGVLYGVGFNKPTHTQFIVKVLTRQTGAKGKVMRLLILAISVLIFLPATAVKAEDGCASPKTDSDRILCFTKLFTEADKELNEVYKELTKALKPGEKKNLVQVQRRWIKFRDAACGAQGTTDVECSYKASQKRTETLRDRLRECKTGHCRGDLLVKEDWASSHLLATKDDPLGQSKAIWKQQGSKLIGNKTLLLGSSVSLSADGNTALVGGNHDHYHEGAAWVWIRSE